MACHFNEHAKTWFDLQLDFDSCLNLPSRARHLIWTHPKWLRSSSAIFTVNELFCSLTHGSSVEIQAQSLVSLLARDFWRALFILININPAITDNTRIVLWGDFQLNSDQLHLPEQIKPNACFGEIAKMASEMPRWEPWSSSQSGACKKKLTPRREEIIGYENKMNGSLKFIVEGFKFRGKRIWHGEVSSLLAWRCCCIFYKMCRLLDANPQSYLERNHHYKLFKNQNTTVFTLFICSETHILLTFSHVRAHI